MAETAFITGIAGFIASNVASQLLDAGWRVVGIDDFNDYYDPRLKHHRIARLAEKAGTTVTPDKGRRLVDADTFRIQSGSIVDRAQVTELMASEKPTVVFNLAARAGVRQSVRRPQDYVDTNITGQLNVLEAMVATGVQKLIYASTASLYAGQPLPFVETSNVDRPISPYAATKKSAELLAHAWHFLHGIDVSIVRYFTAYGPAGRPDMSITRFIKGILRGETITVYGDGNQCRDFTYVDDIAAGTVLATKDVGYDVFNLSGGQEPVTINRTIAMCEEIVGKKAHVEHAGPFECDIVETRASTERARTTLGWNPKTDFETGLHRCVEWHRTHPGF